jgi:hypothetical protein
MHCMLPLRRGPADALDAADEHLLWLSHEESLHHAAGRHADARLQGLEQRGDKVLLCGGCLLRARVLQQIRCAAQRDNPHLHAI